MGEALNLKAKRFGKLVADEPLDERSSNGSIMWRCRCDCGKIVYVPCNNLMSGHTKSCGCSYRDAGYKIINYKIRADNTSGVKGVGFYKRKNMWRAQIKFNKRSYHLLYSADINDCIAIRNEAEKAVQNDNFEKWFAGYRSSIILDE